MEVAGPLLVFAVLALVVWVVGAPLRAGRAAFEESDAAERDRLEAAKEAKLREIRETELDWRTGKLTESDFRAHDRRLRHEAVALLDRLERLGR